MLGNIFVEWHWCTKSRTTSDTKSGLACTGCLQRKNHHTHYLGVSAVDLYSVHSVHTVATW